jgi:hypothetical protein
LALKLNRESKTQYATIAVGATESDALTLTGFAMGMIHMPSTLEGTALTFTVSDTKTGTYAAPELSDGNAISLTVEASKSYAIPEALFGAPYAKLVMGSSQTTTDTVIPVTLRA